MAPSESDGLTLEMVRDSLIRQEDTIIFCLIERAKHPLNKNAYDQTTAAIPGRSGSLAGIMIQEAEALFAKICYLLCTSFGLSFDDALSRNSRLASSLITLSFSIACEIVDIVKWCTQFGRYQNPEEHPFFPENLRGSCVPTFDFPQIFHPAAASVNVNPRVWDAYFNQLLPLIAEPGDDGNYASTVTCDLACLQALSRRIHYGKYVAEVKFRDETEEYEPVIRARDRDALMKLLTFKKVEEMVKRRVEKKAMIFGQEVTLDDGIGRRKIDPGVVSRLYDEWVMPFTKEVEVEYLLHRLD